MSSFKNLIEQAERDNYEMTEKVLSLVLAYAGRRFFDEDDRQNFLEKFVEKYSKMKIKNDKKFRSILVRSIGNVIDEQRKTDPIVFCSICNHSIKAKRPRQICPKCGAFSWGYKSRLVFEQFNFELTESMKLRQDWYELFFSILEKNLKNVDYLPTELVKEIIDAVRGGIRIRGNRGGGLKDPTLYVTNTWYPRVKDVFLDSLREISEIIP